LQIVAAADNETPARLVSLINTSGKLPILRHVVAHRGVHPHLSRQRNFRQLTGAIADEKIGEFEIALQ